MGHDHFQVGMVRSDQTTGWMPSRRAELPRGATHGNRDGASRPLASIVARTCVVGSHPASAGGRWGHGLRRSWRGFDKCRLGGVSRRLPVGASGANGDVRGQRNRPRLLRRLPPRLPLPRRRRRRRPARPRRRSTPPSHRSQPSTPRFRSNSRRWTKRTSSTTRTSSTSRRRGASWRQHGPPWQRPSQSSTGNATSSARPPWIPTSARHHRVPSPSCSRRRAALSQTRYLYEKLGAGNVIADVAKVEVGPAAAADYRVQARRKNSRPSPISSPARMRPGPLRPRPMPRPRRRWPR